MKSDARRCGGELDNSTFYGNTNGLFSDEAIVNMRFVTMGNNGAEGVVFIVNPDRLGQFQYRIQNSVFVGHTEDCNSLPGKLPEFEVASNFNASSDSSCGFPDIDS